MMMSNIVEAMMWVFMFMIFVVMWEMIKNSCMEVLEVPQGSKKHLMMKKNYSKNSDFMDDTKEVKCQCIACNKTVYVPMYYFEGESVHGGRCPHCGRAMTHVRVVE